MPYIQSVLYSFFVCFFNLMEPDAGCFTKNQGSDEYCSQKILNSLIFHVFSISAIFPVLSMIFLEALAKGLFIVLSLFRAINNRVHFITTSQQFVCFGVIMYSVKLNSTKNCTQTSSIHFTLIQLLQTQ